MASIEEMEALVDWAAHYRFTDVVASLIEHMKESGYGPPQTQSVRDRLFLAGLDEQVGSMRTEEELMQVLEGVEAQRVVLRRGVTPREYFDIVVRVKKQIILAVIRDQLAELHVDESELTDADAVKLDFGHYFSLVDHYFPRRDPDTLRHPGGSPAMGHHAGMSEEDVRYMNVRLHNERSSLLYIIQTYESGKDAELPDTIRLQVLLESSTPEACAHHIRDFTKKVEDRILALPRVVENFQCGEGLEARMAILQTRQEVMDKDSIVADNDRTFLRRVRQHLRPLVDRKTPIKARKRSGRGQDANEGQEYRVEQATEPDMSAVELDGTEQKLSRGKGKIRGTEKQILESRTQRLLRSVRAHGADPLQELQSESATSQPIGRRRKRTVNGSSEAEQAGGRVLRVRYADQSRQGRSVQFEDSQYQGDPEEEIEKTQRRLLDEDTASEDESSAREGKGTHQRVRGGRKRKRPQHKQKQEHREASEGTEEDIEEDESDWGGSRPQVNTPEQHKRLSLHRKHDARKAAGRGRRVKEARKGRHPWTEEEMNYIKEAVLGLDMVNNWAGIRDRYRKHWQHERTAVDIKDKWRNMQEKRLRNREPPFEYRETRINDS